MPSIADMQELRRRILRYLFDCALGRPDSVQHIEDIADTLGVDARAVDAEVKQLADEGKVERKWGGLGTQYQPAIITAGGRLSVEQTSPR